MRFAILVICLVANPDFVDAPVLQTMSVCCQSSKLADIESRMPSGHGYAFPKAPMTWAHETTHGLNSRLRSGSPGFNAFYVMNGKAVIVKEPKGTLWQIGSLVPDSLRGPSFNLYLGEQRRYWDETPTYLLDEWTAYINGSEVGSELNEDGWHYELLQAINFTVYSIAMAKSIRETDPQYDDTQLKAFIAFNSKRTMAIWKRLDESGVDDLHVRQIRAYLEAWKLGTESASLRKFSKEYFDEDLL